MDGYAFFLPSIMLTWLRYILFSYFHICIMLYIFWFFLLLSAYMFKFENGNNDWMPCCSTRLLQVMPRLMGLGLQNQQMMTCLVSWHVLITWSFHRTLRRYYFMLMHGDKIKFCSFKSLSLNELCSLNRKLCTRNYSMQSAKGKDPLICPDEILD